MLDERREESWRRCPRAFCAHCCALGDECAERVCSARSRRYARLCRACSNRNAPSFQAFCCPARGNDSLAHRIHQRTSSQLYGRAARTASLKAAKLVHFPHVPQGAAQSSSRGPASVRLETGVGTVEARREVSIDRMAAAIGEMQFSHRSGPPVTGRNLAPINGCRSSECGGEEESRHVF